MSTRFLSVRRRLLASGAGLAGAVGHPQSAGLLGGAAIAGLALGGCASPAGGPPASALDPALAALAAGSHRRPANVARDGARHPLAVIAFLGIRPDSTVVEILPGSAGYYLELLAPWLRERGRYIAASRDETAPARYIADHQRLLERLRADPARYDRVGVTKFRADAHPIAPDGSADFVLTFRNLHNWVERGELDGALRAFRRALRPGGVLGVVDHRGRPDRPQAAQTVSGYLREDFAIELIERGGFRLAGRSEVNANPRDTKDHPEGVWTLPPSLRLGARDRARYLAIGESDRFTLRFVRT